MPSSIRHQQTHIPDLTSQTNQYSRSDVTAPKARREYESSDVKVPLRHWWEEWLWWKVHANPRSNCNISAQLTLKCTYLCTLAISHDTCFHSVANQPAKLWEGSGGGRGLRQIDLSAAQKQTNKQNNTEIILITSYRQSRHIPRLTRVETIPMNNETQGPLNSATQRPCTRILDLK